MHSFWTLADAKALNALITPDSHVVMVGAGFIAFTILNGIIQRAGKVTIVEVAERILPRMVDATGAKLVSDWLQARGVTLRTGAKLQSIADQGGKKVLAFESGEPIQADAVVMATGIRTNLEWLQGSGVEVNQGVVHAIEPTAMDHGRVVGANMAGKDVAYRGSLLMNIVGVAGLDIASFGDWDASGAEVIEGLRPERSAYRKYLFDGDRLVGAIYVGTDNETWAGNELGMLKGLVQSGQSVGAWKDYLKANPFDIKKAFLANGTVSKLMPSTTLGQPSPSPRG